MTCVLVPLGSLVPSLKASLRPVTGEGSGAVSRHHTLKTENRTREPAVGRPTRTRRRPHLVACRLRGPYLYTPLASRGGQVSSAEPDVLHCKIGGACVSDLEQQGREGHVPDGSAKVQNGGARVRPPRSGTLLRGHTTAVSAPDRSATSATADTSQVRAGFCVSDVWRVSDTRHVG